MRYEGYEVRVYHLGQGNREGALLVEPCYCIWQAVVRVTVWESLGFIAICLPYGRVDALKARRKRPLRVPRNHILVDRDEHKRVYRRAYRRGYRKRMAPP